MAKIFAGRRYTSEQLTAPKIHAVIDTDDAESLDLTGPQFQDITDTDMASGGGLIEVSSSAPTNTANMWFDNTNNLFRRYNSATSEWEPIGGDVILSTNNTGSTTVVGDIYAVDTSQDDSFVDTSTSPQETRVLGMAIEAVDDAARCLMRIHGRVTINSHGLSGGASDQYFQVSDTTPNKVRPTPLVGQDGPTLGFVFDFLSATTIDGYLFGHTLYW